MRVPPDFSHLPDHLQEVADLTTNDVALLTGLSDRQVRRYIEAGELPCVRYGRKVRIPYKAYLAWRAGKQQ